MESGFNGATSVSFSVSLLPGTVSFLSYASVTLLSKKIFHSHLSLVSLSAYCSSSLLFWSFHPGWHPGLRPAPSPITPCCFSIFPKAGKICPQSKKSAKPRAFFIVVTLANTACSCLFPESPDAGTEQSFRGSRFRRKCTVYGDGRSEPAAGCPLHGDRSDNTQIRPVLHPPAGADIPACRRRENRWPDARRLQRRPPDG